MRGRKLPKTPDVVSRSVTSKAKGLHCHAMLGSMAQRSFHFPNHTYRVPMVFIMVVFLSPYYFSFWPFLPNPTISALVLIISWELVLFLSHLDYFSNILTGVQTSRMTLQTTTQESFQNIDLVMSFLHLKPLSSYPGFQSQGQTLLNLLDKAFPGLVPALPSNSSPITLTPFPHHTHSHTKMHTHGLGLWPTSRALA